MVKRLTKFAQVAGIMLAMALTFSCSGDDGDGGDPNNGGSSSPSYSPSGVSSSSSKPSGVSSSSVTAPSSNSTPSSSSVAVSSSSSKPSSSSGASSSSVGVSSNSGGSDKGNNISNYKTVQIGSQTWMAENLNYDVSGSVCYGNDPANCDKYGRLYDWATAMALDASCNTSSCASQVTTPHRGICPSGWHIPSDADWNVLMKFVNPSCSDNKDCAGAGTKLKAREGWEPYSGVTAGTDELGFSALPGGYGISSVGFFGFVGLHGSWWSASEYDSFIASNRGMNYSNKDALYYDNGSKYGLFSVRCVMD